jgi:hypothetical protein
LNIPFLGCVRFQEAHIKLENQPPFIKNRLRDL